MSGGRRRELTLTQTPIPNPDPDPKHPNPESSEEPPCILGARNPDLQLLSHQGGSVKRQRLQLMLPPGVDGGWRTTEEVEAVAARLLAGVRVLLQRDGPSPELNLLVGHTISSLQELWRAAEEAQQQQSPPPLLCHQSSGSGSSMWEEASSDGSQGDQGDGHQIIQGDDDDDGSSSASPGFEVDAIDEEDLDGGGDGDPGGGNDPDAYDLGIGGGPDDHGGDEVEDDHRAPLRLRLSPLQQPAAGASTDDHNHLPLMPGQPVEAQWGPFGGAERFWRGAVVDHYVGPSQPGDSSHHNHHYTVLYNDGTVEFDKPAVRVLPVQGATKVSLLIAGSRQDDALLEELRKARARVRALHAAYELTPMSPSSVWSTPCRGDGTGTWPPSGMPGGPGKPLWQPNNMGWWRPSGEAATADERGVADALLRGVRSEEWIAALLDGRSGTLATACQMVVTAVRPALVELVLGAMVNEAWRLRAIKRDDVPDVQLYLAALGGVLAHSMAAVSGWLGWIVLRLRVGLGLGSRLVRVRVATPPLAGRWAGLATPAGPAPCGLPADAAGLPGGRERRRLQQKERKQRFGTGHASCLARAGAGGSACGGAACEWHGGCEPRRSRCHDRRCARVPPGYTRLGLVGCWPWPLSPPAPPPLPPLKPLPPHPGVSHRRGMSVKAASAEARATLYHGSTTFAKHVEYFSELMRRALEAGDSVLFLAAAVAAKMHLGGATFTLSPRP